jgi:acyl dehydratase
MVKVGDVARRTRTVLAEDIELFTELTGDRNPLHYDQEAARASRFGSIIVQGGITSGLLNGVVAEDLPGPGSVFLRVAWDFKAPVYPDDEITAEVEVLEVRDDKPSAGCGPRSRTRTALWCWTAPHSCGRSPLASSSSG